DSLTSAARAGATPAGAARGAFSLGVAPATTPAGGGAGSLKVSLTQRSIARRVQLVTGHAHDGRLPDDLDLAALADPQATTAVYMPLGTLPELVRRLLAAGIEPGRPACAVFNATRPDETAVSGTVATIGGLIERARVDGPCVLILGRALASRWDAAAGRSQAADAVGAAQGPCTRRRAQLQRCDNATHAE